MGSNCMASLSIGCLFCCQGCKAEKLKNAFTFLPPAPSYTFEQGGQQKDVASELPTGRLQYITEPLRKNAFYQQAAEQTEMTILRTAHGEQTPAVWLRQRPLGNGSSGSSDSGKEPLVLLHCHGNATDIGMMMGPYLDLSQKLGCEVVGVEYSGYGISTGAPSARNCCADLEAAYQHLLAQGVAPERIVAYGQSVGTGPVVGLAAKQRLGGLILHSPMMSGIKIIDPMPDRCCRPSCVYHCFDFFPNDVRIKQITCPAFVIHGQLDDIIPFYHGAKLREAVPEPYRWPGYFPRAGHNDIIEMNVATYFSEVAAFMAHVAKSSGRGEASPPGVLGKPGQIEMSGPPFEEEANRPPAALPYQEPVVGPEDGRYDKMRAGKVNKGQARDLQAVPTG